MRRPQRGEFTLVPCAELLDADPLDEEAEPGQVLVLAISVLVEHALDRFGDEEGVGRRNELLEQGSDPAAAAHAAAHIYREAFDPVLSPGHEADVVDGGTCAVTVAAGEGDLELAGQLEGEGIGHEPLRGGDRVGGHIEEFVGADPGIEAGGEVADGVPAAAVRGETGSSEGSQGRQDRVEGNPVHLEFLAGGDVQHAIAPGAGHVREMTEVTLAPRRRRGTARATCRCRIRVARTRPAARGSPWIVPRMAPARNWSSVVWNSSRSRDRFGWTWNVQFSTGAVLMGGAMQDL